MFDWNDCSKVEKIIITDKIATNFGVNSNKTILEILILKGKSLKKYTSPVYSETLLNEHKYDLLLKMISFYVPGIIIIGILV